MAWLQEVPGGWRICRRVGGRGSKVVPGPVIAGKVKATEALRNVREQERLQGKIPPGVQIDLSELLKRWVTSRKTHRKASDAYCNASERTLRHLIAAKGWGQAIDITKDSLGDVGIGGQRLVRSLLRYAEDLKQRINRDALKVEPPPRPDRPEADLLTDDEVGALIARAARFSRSDGVLAHMLATYGHRPETAAQAKVGDVDLVGKTIELSVKSRGGMRRIRHPLMPVSVELLQGLVDGRAADAPLFHSHRGVAWGSGQKIAQWWFLYVGKEVLGTDADRAKDGPRPPTTGKGYGIYQLKRYAITRMLGLGMSLKTIASITGHKCPSVLMKYARTNEEQQQAAITALSLAGATTVLPRKSVNY